MKKSFKKRHIGLTALIYVLSVSGVLLIVNACNKSTRSSQTAVTAATTKTITATPLQQGAPQTKVVTVLAVTPAPDGITNWVVFRGLAEQFNVTDATVLAALNKALNNQQPVKITFDPWKAIVTQVAASNDQERMAYGAREIVHSPGSSISVDLDRTNPDIINNTAGIGVLNTTSATTTGLMNVVPDMATAQLMFDYIAHQACEIPGPYGVDFCITFQYCEDGCYARAHKMCYVINNRFHYATHKIFSFAWPGAYTLSVKAEKWGGCCINWWYHVAPLVNIKTPSGTYAYVFDPAMFDQPVLLATWLHAQQNPACAGSHTPKVTSYNIQPTTSYSPNDTATFDTDPLYASTDSTLVNYHSLISCP